MAAIAPILTPLAAHASPAEAAARLREEASVRAEQLDAALRAELAPQAAWHRP